MTNVLTSLNDLKIKVNDLDAGNLKTVPVNLSNINEVVDNEVVKNTKINPLKKNVNNFEKKIPYAITSIYINQYNTDKQDFEKKFGDIENKTPDTKFNGYNCLEYKN